MADGDLDDAKATSSPTSRAPLPANVPNSLPSSVLAPSSLPPFLTGTGRGDLGRQKQAPASDPASHPAPMSRVPSWMPSQQTETNEDDCLPCCDNNEENQIVELQVSSCADQEPTTSCGNQHPTNSQNSHTSHSIQRPGISRLSSHSTQQAASSHNSHGSSRITDPREKSAEIWRSGTTFGHSFLSQGFEATASNFTSGTDAEGGNSTPTAHLANSQRERNLLTTRLRGSCSNVDVRVRELLSFEGCEELLRGMDLNRMLANRAAIFSHHSGSASTYKLSKPTKTLDAFISHNWSVPRWRKYLCLVFHYNTGLALGVTGFVLAILTVFAVKGNLPSNYYRDREWPKTWVFSFACVPCYLLVLFFARDGVRPFGRGGCVFLDKTCIHQDDVEVQAQGIQKLGAFLRHSERMVICYSEVYMRKLWTVYEVASFLALHPLDRMDVIPVFLPIFILSLIFVTWLVNGCAHVFELWFNISGLNYQILIFVLLVFVPYTARWWEREKVALELELSNFNIRKTLCACEEDRPVIYANIAALMRETGNVSYEADEDEALDGFEDLVRATLPYALINSIGAYGVRYKQLIVIGFALSLPQFLDWAPGINVGMPARHVATYLLWYVDSIFIIIPFVLYATLLIERRCLHLKGVWNWLYTWITPAFFATGPVLLFRALVDYVEVVAREDNGILIVWAAGSVLLSGFIGVVLNETAVCGWRSTSGRNSRESSSEGTSTIRPSAHIPGTDLERKSKGGDSSVRWASEHTVCTFPSGRESYRDATTSDGIDEVVFDIDTCAAVESQEDDENDEGHVAATYSV